MKNNFHILIALIFCALAGSVSGHPLGNFSINQYSRLEVGKSRITIRQVLDLAEIPAFQEKSAIDTDQDGAMSAGELNAYAERLTPEHLANLVLTVNDRPLTLRAESTAISLNPGAGDLPTLRIVWDLAADPADLSEINRVRFENKNYPDRTGWNEIVVNRLSGVTVFDSNVYGNGLTDELKEYPQETLAAPPAERNAVFSVMTNGELPENARPLQNRNGEKTAAVQKDGFAELIAVPEITPAIVLFGLLLAVGFGAFHALSPGHGKAIVGAYLVGSRGTVKHAAFLGLTVTVTHTLGVFALGLITLFASSYILPEKLMPVLGFMSGVLVLYIGLTLFKTRLFSALGWEKSGHSRDGHTHSHDDGHTHSHDDGHSHSPPEEISLKSLLALGISGGLLPCPSALVLMLAAISYGRIGYGLILIIAFSFGLAATLTAVGLIFLYLGRAFGGSAFGQNRIFKALPVLSALVITGLGAVICWQFLG